MQEQRHPLGDLIREQMTRNQWSLEAVVRRAAERGEKLGKSNLDAVIKTPPKQLSQATLFGLAAGIGVTPNTVASAALASMGVNPSRPELTDAESAIRIDPSLTERDRKILIGIVGVLRNQERDRDADLFPATTAQAKAEGATNTSSAREKTGDEEFQDTVNAVLDELDDDPPAAQNI